jgi:Spy/CpxP family protein refolding chaperone
MKKTITTLAVFALGASLAVAAPQAGQWQGHKGHHGFMSEKMAAKLNLSEAQKTQIKAIKQQTRQDNQAFFQSARATFQEYRAAKEANDTAKLQQLQPTVDANKAQMKAIREQERTKILSVLTPDQRAQLDAMRAQHQQHQQQK